MSALTTERARSESRWKYKQYTLASGNKAYQGGAIGLNPATGKVQPMSASPTLQWLGFAVETVDATSADQTLNVDLVQEITISWFANGTSSDAVQATDIGKDAYFLDDQTVSILRTGKAVAGRIIAFDSTKGVGVEKITTASGLAANPSLGAFATNALAPTDIVNGAFYDVPTTAGASTITLPTAAADGTRAYFLADGTKNGHTVQYIDQAGTTNITTALTASKRHLVEVCKLGGKWFANAYVSP